MGRYDSKLKKSEIVPVRQGLCWLPKFVIFESCKGTCSLNCKGTRVQTSF